jgi:hypothetical protein
VIGCVRVRINQLPEYPKRDGHTSVTSSLRHRSTAPFKHAATAPQRQLDHVHDGMRTLGFIRPDYVQSV